MKYIGVDFDGTLAVHRSGDSVATAGPPILPMVSRVKQWLADGKEVRIITARVSPEWNDVERQVEIIQDWCQLHLGQVLVIQAHKTGAMLELWDDRAIGVVPNVGLRADELQFAIDRAVAMQRIENVLQAHGYLRAELEGEHKNERLIVDLVDAIQRRPS